MHEQPRHVILSNGTFHCYNEISQLASKYKRLDGPSYISIRGEEWYEFGTQDNYLTISPTGHIVYWPDSWERIFF